MIDSGVLSHIPQAALDYAIRKESTGSSNLPNVPLNRNEMDRLGFLQKKVSGKWAAEGSVMGCGGGWGGFRG